ncbi:hypothetical protein [Sagittula salina]|uniref:Uncharacterized protein n=1 Tax=Sagittula salina TaxID=2820268 RepID=A0A940MKN0_9RHOB|nr:hypothetical protein [Sagittula salina]MBP0481104.1 hypothetical protein [Sagittula salina]
MIEWQDTPPKLEPYETIAAEGDWKNFSRTVPKIEVRIGGLLSLERISQDSAAYDKGRDHIRVMEIICAYIRNNSPAQGAVSWHPYEELFTAFSKNLSKKASSSMRMLTL